MWIWLVSTRHQRPPPKPQELVHKQAARSRYALPAMTTHVREAARGFNLDDHAMARLLALQEGIALSILKHTERAKPKNPSAYVMVQAGTAAAIGAERQKVAAIGAERKQVAMGTKPAPGAALGAEPAEASGLGGRGCEHCSCHKCRGLDPFPYAFWRLTRALPQLLWQPNVRPGQRMPPAPIFRPTAKPPSEHADHESYSADYYSEEESRDDEAHESPAAVPAQPSAGGDTAGEPGFWFGYRHRVPIGSADGGTFARFLTAKKQLKELGEIRPLVLVFKRGGERPECRSESRAAIGAESDETRVHQVMGLVSKHDGEFRHWMPTKSTEVWTQVDPEGDYDEFARQPQLKPGITWRQHVQTEGTRPSALAIARAASTILVSDNEAHWARDVQIVSLPEVMVHYAHKRDAEEIYCVWCECPVVISKKPRGATGRDPKTRGFFTDTGRNQPLAVASTLAWRLRSRSRRGA